MKLSTYEKWYEDEIDRREWILKHHPDQIKSQDDVEARHREKRERFRKEFPFTAVVEGHYPETDNASRWCWRNISPPHGPCLYEHYSEYPGCPLVLATEYIQEGSYLDNQGVTHTWAQKCYKEVEPHEHEGSWTSLWLGKTGYDYGFMEFYFKNEADRDAFVRAVPEIDLGEKYS